MTHLPPVAPFATVLLAASAGLAAQQQFDPLTREQIPFLQAGSLPPVVADFDGDGRDDLFFGGQVRSLWLRAATPGVFTDASNLLPSRSGLRDRDAVALDHDGDGDLDLLIAVAQRENKLYRNDGPAGFTDVTGTQPWRSASFAPATQVLAVGDVTGDGLVDLLFGDFEPNDRVFHGQANGVFNFCQSCQPTPLPDTRACLLEDFDGDGDLDLFRLAAPGMGLTLGIYETNDGLGNWSVVSGAIPTTAADPAGAVAVDYDHDGDLDVLAYGSTPGLLLYVNQGGTSFTAGAAPAPVGSHVNSVTVADRDGDGRDDLLVTSGQGTALLRGTIGGRFLPFPGLELPDPRLPSFAGGLVDADGDNDLDIVLNNGQVELWIDEANRFVRATAAELTAQRGAVAVGDVDGDGDPDVLVATTTDPDRVGQILLNDGDGRFTHGAPLPSSNAPAPANPDAVLLADLNGDGALDALIGQTTGQPVLLFGRGDGRFNRSPVGALPNITTPQTSFAVGDADGDGDLDVAIAGSGIGGSGPGLTLLINDGAGGFAIAPAGSVPPLPELAGDVEFADVDGDGDRDLLVGQFNRTVGTQLLLWQNDGTGRFTTAAIQPPGTPGYDFSIAVADYDADGDLDVSIGFALLENDGSGNFTDVTATQLDAPLGVAPVFVDADSDGDLDLFTIDNAFRQDASGMFRADANLFTGRAPRVYATADVDLDGDVDLIGSYALYRNRLREIHVPELPRVGGTLRIRVDNQKAPFQLPQAAFVLLATQRLAQPVALPDFGLFRLDPVHVLDRLVVSVPQNAPAEVTIQVPNQLSLAGGDVHTQALIFNGRVPDWRLTRAETITIVR